MRDLGYPFTYVLSGPFLLIRKTQITTTMRSYLTHVRIFVIKQTRANKCWRGCGEKGTLLHHWWECKLVQPLCKMEVLQGVWRFLKKLKIELPYDQVISFLGVYSKEMKTLTQISAPSYSLQYSYNS